MPMVQHNDMAMEDFLPRWRMLFQPQLSSSARLGSEIRILTHRKKPGQPSMLIPYLYHDFHVALSFFDAQMFSHACDCDNLSTIPTSSMQQITKSYLGIANPQIGCAVQAVFSLIVCFPSYSSLKIFHTRALLHHFSVREVIDPRGSGPMSIGAVQVK